MDSDHRIFIQKLRETSRRLDVSNTDHLEDIIEVKESNILNARGDSLVVKTTSLRVDYNTAWVHNSGSNECLRCHIPFTLLNRKHHCRLCGFLVCNQCSLNREVIENLVEPGGSRVCDICFRDRQKLKTERQADFVSESLKNNAIHDLTSDNDKDNTKLYISAAPAQSISSSSDKQPKIEQQQQEQVQPISTTSAPTSSTGTTASTAYYIDTDTRKQSTQTQRQQQQTFPGKHLNEFDEYRSVFNSGTSVDDNDDDGDIGSYTKRKQPFVMQHHVSISEKGSQLKLSIEEAAKRLEEEKQRKLAEFIVVDEDERWTVAEREEARRKAIEVKERQLEEDKQRKLADFTAGATLSVAQREEARRLAEQEKQLRMEEEKKKKLAEFVGNYEVDHHQNKHDESMMTRTERIELARKTEEQEKKDRLEREKQAKLASFLGTTVGAAAAGETEATGGGGGGGTAQKKLTLGQKMELKRKQEEQEKAERLEREKQAKIATFLSGGHDNNSVSSADGTATAPTAASVSNGSTIITSDGPKRSVSARYLATAGSSSSSKSSAVATVATAAAPLLSAGTNVGTNDEDNKAEVAVVEKEVGTDCVVIASSSSSQQHQHQRRQQDGDNGTEDEETETHIEEALVATSVSSTISNDDNSNTSVNGTENGIQEGDVVASGDVA